MTPRSVPWGPAGRLLLLVAAGRAEVPPLETDRPDQTECSSLVTPGRWQVETGWTHAADGDGGIAATADALPQVLVRIGFLNRLELRCIHEGWGIERRASGGSTTSGWNDAAIGVKVFLTPERSPWPVTCLNVHTSLPIGAASRSSGRYDPDFRFLFAHSLPADFSFGYNLGAAWAPALSLEYTASLARDLSDHWGAFLEVFGDAPPHGPGAHSLDAGLTFGPRGNVQLDFAAGAGLTDAAEDWFVGIGISYRYPD